MNHLSFKKTGARCPLRGFTLIELLIVVAIIAILAAIAVPNFLEAQVRAKNAQTLSNMRSIMTAAEAYRVDNNSALPALYLDPPHWYWISRWGYWSAVTTPVPYMSSCPEDLYYKLASNTEFWGEQWRKIFHNYYV
jgi:prepilin-type N-terminal cleavage/methylation domain-containing protein